MTTDITDMAQRDKFESWLSEKPFHARYTHWSNTLNAYDYTSIQLAWEAYQAGGAELLEALEKAQTKAIEQGRTACELFDEVTTLRQRIAELESFRTAYMEWSDKTYWVQTDKRFDVLTPWGKHRADVLKEYIEHLESRTVTVSKSDIFNVPGGETYGGGEMIPVNTLCLYLAEHGIKWEAE